MFEMPCSASIDEQNHDAGYALRCEQDDAVSAAKLAFIAARVAELTRSARFDCFMTAEIGQDEALAAVANATTPDQFYAAKRSLDELIERGAEIIAERDWRGREATVAFGIMESFRRGTDWWGDQ